MAKKILSSVGKVAKFALGGGLVGVGIRALTKKKKAETPTAAAPTERVMPLPDDEAVSRARKLSMLRQRSRSGRSSTILTGSSGSTLGGS